MERVARRRKSILGAALAALACGAAVFASPNLVQKAWAQESTVTCTATCRNGTCTGNKPYCVCTCSWFVGSPICNCTEDGQSSPSQPPQEEQPVG